MSVAVLSRHSGLPVFCGLTSCFSRLVCRSRFCRGYNPFGLYYAERELLGASRGGDEQNRTVDPLLARQVLSQLSYTPMFSQVPSTLL